MRARYEHHAATGTLADEIPRRTDLADALGAKAEAETDRFRALLIRETIPDNLRPAPPEAQSG